MELFDTHCHIDVDEFSSDRNEVIARSLKLGVRNMLVPAIHARGWPYLLELCSGCPQLHPALGLHPVYLNEHLASDVKLLEINLAVHPEVVAIGEIGLDFFLTELDREKQQALFESQLGIARETNLPVILHSRKSHDQTLATLRRIQVRGGIVHAFSGSLQQAEQFIALGFKLGFGGTLTYERANKIRSIAKTIAIESIVLETDAPDIPTSQHRGERNSPEYLPLCLQALSELRDEDPQIIATRTTQNAFDVLGIKQVAA